MKRNVLEYLEETAGKYPDKTGVTDESGSCTFRELMEKAGGREALWQPGLNGGSRWVCSWKKASARFRRFSALRTREDFMFCLIRNFPNPARPDSVSTGTHP